MEFIIDANHTDTVRLVRTTLTDGSYVYAVHISPEDSLALVKIDTATLPAAQTLFLALVSPRIIDIR